MPATANHVSELCACASDPAALFGHQYVRYRGDLSGGQIITTIVRRHYGIEDGLSLYVFDIPKPTIYKDGYLTALDDLPLSESGRDSALAATTRDLELNHRIFLDLEAAGIRRHLAHCARLRRQRPRHPVGGGAEPVNAAVRMRAGRSGSRASHHHQLRPLQT